MPDLLAAAQEFAVDATAHASTFHSAWSKVLKPIVFRPWLKVLAACLSQFRDRAALTLVCFQVMNADRFDGPYSNLCDAPAAAASDSSSGLYTASQVPQSCATPNSACIDFFDKLSAQPVASLSPPSPTSPLFYTQFFGSVVGISIGAAIFASVITW